MVASNARKNFGFLHISFYKVVQIVLPIIDDNAIYRRPTGMKALTRNSQKISISIVLFIISLTIPTLPLQILSSAEILSLSIAQLYKNKPTRNETLFLSTDKRRKQSAELELPLFITNFTQ